jgi:hypothetical protein
VCARVCRARTCARACVRACVRASVCVWGVIEQRGKSLPTYADGATPTNNNWEENLKSRLHKIKVIEEITRATGSMVHRL